MCFTANTTEKTQGRPRLGAVTIYVYIYTHSISYEFIWCIPCSFFPMNRRHGTEGGAGCHGQTAASEVHQQHPVLHTPRDQQVTHRIFEDEQDHPGKLAWYTLNPGKHGKDTLRMMEKPGQDMTLVDSNVENDENDRDGLLIFAHAISCLLICQPPDPQFWPLALRT